MVCKEFGRATWKLKRLLTAFYAWSLNPCNHHRPFAASRNFHGHFANSGVSFSVLITKRLKPQKSKGRPSQNSRKSIRDSPSIRQML